MLPSIWIMGVSVSFFRKGVGVAMGQGSSGRYTTSAAKGVETEL